MLGVTITALALLGLGPVDAAGAGAPEARDSYEAALAQVGRDADAHVRLALWCEAHGLDAERLKHLSLAVLNAPGHPLARGLMGLVSYGGRWKRPEAVAAALAADPARKAALEQYEAKRGKLPAKADAHWKLALWCEENGLAAEAVAQLWETVRLDPAHEGARKRLGFTKQKDGRWLTAGQLAREKMESELQKQADRHWKPILEKSRGELAKKDPAARSRVLQELAQVTDPRAVPMVWAVFAIGDEANQRVAVQVLGQIADAPASRALAMLAVFSASAEVRRTAAETLAQRDVREFGGLLVGLLRDPVQYEVRHVQGPGKPGELFIRGKKANVKRLYSPPDVPQLPAQVQAGGRVLLDENGLPVVAYDAGQFRTGRIPVPTLLGGGPALDATLFAGEYAGPATGSFLAPSVDARVAQQQGRHNALARSGVTAPQAAPIGQNLMASAALANALSWSNYGGAAGGLNPYAQMQQIAAMMVGSGQVGMQNGMAFTLDRQVLVPIGRMAVEAEKTALSAEEQLKNDVAAIDRFNEPIQRMNERVTSILKPIAGKEPPGDRESWVKWWVDQIGYTTQPQKVSDATPTITEDVPLSYQPQPIPIGEFYGVVEFHRMSCFGAGTLVHTLTGTRPIETLKVGDAVLSQDTKSGALGFQPVLAVHHNPPSKTFKIALGNETITSSEFHRFWKAGEGWVMARDLKPGQVLRTLGGLAKVESVETGAVQPVFNLDVAESANFFAGAQGALVHDNTLPDLRLAPFDAAPEPVLTAAPRPRP
jgi:hypothetical protein